MNVISPIPITDSMLFSSTVPETPPPTYNSSTTYAFRDQVSVAGSAGTLTVYESLENANFTNDPTTSPLWWKSMGSVYQAYSDTGVYTAGDRVAAEHVVYESLVDENTEPLTDPLKWLAIGATNCWAMFDLLRSTATVAPRSMTITLTPGRRVDSIALLNLVAKTAIVTVESGGVVQYSHAEDLNSREALDWLEYFFAEFSNKNSLVLFDLPPYSDATINILLTSAMLGTIDSFGLMDDLGRIDEGLGPEGAADVACGACVIGLKEYIGKVLYSAESDVLNFSTVARDFAGGVSTLVQRRNVPKTIQQIVVEKSRINRIRALRDALNATPAVWSGLDDITDPYFEAILILGFYKKFSINLAYPDYATIALELEEI